MGTYAERANAKRDGDAQQVVSAAIENIGTSEHRNIGTSEHRNIGTAEQRNSGTAEQRNSGTNEPVPVQRTKRGTNSGLLKSEH